MASVRTIGGLLVLLAITACAATRDDVSNSEDEVARTQSDDNAPLLVKDPRTLVALEDRGLSFATIMGAASGTGEALGAVPAYQQIAQTIMADITRLRRADNQAGVGVTFPHRQFDPAWLSSPESRFELVAVVNRTDRMHVEGCGELRLIYRLAYTATRSASRLPMTLNVVYPQPDDGQHCQTVAQRWLDAQSGSVDALLTGPLAHLPPYKQIELNFQAVRWPSNERPDFGGHAEYILRVMRPLDGVLRSVALENTPRTDLSDADREELRGWIRDHLSEIDDGTALVPEKFLAQFVTSAGPEGIVRGANRPYARIFGDADAAFGDLPFGGAAQVKSPAALMRRLDTMTCNGCHQSRSIAGFHLLGEDRDPQARLNALAVGRSPHLVEELGWRTDQLRHIAAGEPASAPRPFADHGSTAGKVGMHCGLGDPGFASWTCAEGLVCTDVHGGPTGMCLPPGAPVGSICETGTTTFSTDSHRDRVLNHRVLQCDQAGRDSRCDPVSKGFPNGMCRVDCNMSDVGTIVDRTICGLVPSAAGLTECLAAHRPFQACLLASNAATYLQTCDVDNPCRDDYACARVLNGPSGIGACMPPYFAFQARVDGHLFD